MAGVLDGIRVLDLSWGTAGPMASLLLADHGASVTKIEPPRGDPFRSQLGYHAWNRGKRSAVLDLKDAGDRALFLKLAASADVLLESFRPGVTARLGIEYPQLSAANPRLVYCSITGYGRHGPDAARPGYDALVAARTGLHWEQRGRVGGTPTALSGAGPFAPEFEAPAATLQGPARNGPVFPASRFPSLGAAYAAALGISAALRAREITGRGQWVETSLQQGALAAGVMFLHEAEHVDAPHFTTWIADQRAPKGHFECADGRWVHMWPPNPRFVLAAGEGERLDASADLSVRDDPDRIGLGPEELFVLHHYQPLMAATVRKFSADAWTRAGAEAGVCIQTVRAPEEALVDPLLLAEGCIAEVDDPQLGRIRSVGIVHKLATSPGTVGAGQAPVGRDTEAVRAEAESASAAPAARPATSSATLRGGPLEGIRVLDFGMAVAGPFGAQLLSDLGADVIKVNALHDWYWHSNHIAMCCNRGKRSIAVDMKHPEAKAVIERLIASADVLMHNMRYPAAVKLGIDYASLRDEHPRLVYCHTRGHEHGPRENLPGNDQTGACLAGVEWEDGGCGHGGKPMWSLTNMGDTGNGFLAAIAVCQALYERETSGRGQWVETAIVNAQLLNASHTVLGADGSEFERPRLDALQTGLSAGVRLYPTADGWLCLSLANDTHWRALGEALALPELRAGGRLANAAARRTHEAELIGRIEAALAPRGATHWFAALDAAGVPCEVSSATAVRELWNDPDAAARQWVTRHRHPMAGELRQVGLSLSLSETPTRLQGPPLLVGDHTRSLLAELGFDAPAIDALFEAGAVGDETLHPALGNAPAAGEAAAD